jgi:hypothetical protein
VFARDGSGKGLPDLACEAHPDIGGGGEDVAPLTNAEGICFLTLPATGAWIFLIHGQGLDRQVLAIGRTVVEPGRTSEVVIEVP